MPHGHLCLPSCMSAVRFRGRCATPQVAPDAAALLWERSNGLPSYLEQLVVFLQLFVQSQMQSRAAEESADSSRCSMGGWARGTAAQVASLAGVCTVGKCALSLELLQPVTPLMDACCVACRPRRRNTVEEVQAMAQAGLEFIRSNVSITSIITGGLADGRHPTERCRADRPGCLGTWEGNHWQLAAHLRVHHAHALPCLASEPPCLPFLPAADRVDRLKPDEQLTLKVASVLGLTVYRQLLQASRGAAGASAPGSCAPLGWHERMPTDYTPAEQFPAYSASQYGWLAGALLHSRC